MRSLALLLTSALLPACHEIVVLGSECPSGSRLCLDEPGSTPDGSGSGLDSGVNPQRDAGLELDADGALDVADAGPLGDAADTGSEAPELHGATDGALGVFPAFQNPSFELVSGSTGDVNDQRIAPWYACRTGIWVQASAQAGLRSVSPT